MGGGSWGTPCCGCPGRLAGAEVCLGQGGPEALLIEGALAEQLKLK